MLTAPLSRKQLLHRRREQMQPLTMQVRGLADRLRQRSTAIIRKATASLLRLNQLQLRQKRYSLQLRQRSHKHRHQHLPSQRPGRDSRRLLPSNQISKSGKEYI